MKSCYGKTQFKSTLVGLAFYSMILYSLRIPLVHESTDVRAATVRTLRHLIKTSEDSQALVTFNMHYLIARCLDIELDNKVERIQALKLARNLLYQGKGQDLPMILLRSIVAIAEEGKKEDDRLYRAALAILCEISVVCPLLFIEAGGVKALTFCLLDTSMPKVAEAVLASLLRLHNDPWLRPKANVNLGVVVAPFTEFTYIHHFSSSSSTEKQDMLEERERRLKCAEQALLSTIRSWSGFIQLCQPRAVGPSHLQAVVDILYLNNNEVRQCLITMFYDMLNLRSLPNKESSFSEGLKNADPCSFRDAWKLADEFVAGEGLDLLPPISKSRPNLVENHLSLLVHCLLKCDLPDALVKVIVDTEESSLSVNATILLGELLHLANVLLPREVNVCSHCLPGLLREVSSLNPNRSTRAQEAVVALQKIHALKKRGPKANSLFFDQILANSGIGSGEYFVGDRLHYNAMINKPCSDEKLKQNIKLSSVNINYDPNVWDWDLVTSILRSPPSASFKSLEVNDFRNFVQRITDYFKPTSGRFCRVELSDPRSKILARTACYLMDFLIEADSFEALRILDEFLKDVQDCFNIVIQADNANECILAPAKLATTVCQYYFLFIGRLSRSSKGRAVLDQRSILGHFTELLSMRSDLYPKLVISCLDYSAIEWGSRILLAKALKESSETCRIYATRFLGVLIRSKTPNVAQWGIELLTDQLFDCGSKIVPTIALNLLDEAADDKMNLEAMVCALQNKNVDHLGIRGEVLKVRLLVSSTYGLKVLNNEEMLEDIIKSWTEHLNQSYVSLVEDLVSDGLTRHQRDDDLSYGRRTFDAHAVRSAFLPFHLYGQLASTKLGLEVLIRHPDIHEMLGHLANAGDNNKNWQLTKKSIWAVANVCASYEGACFVDREGGIESLIKISEESNILSLKATAFYALSLVATTRFGCQVLASKGWCTLKYGRDDPWPVLEDWFIRFQIATIILDQDEPEDVPMDDVDHFKASTRRSSSLQYTPVINDADDTTDDTIHPRSSSLSSRKRLSNIFKSLSDKKDGNKSSSITRRIKRSLFKENSHGDSSSAAAPIVDTIEENDIINSASSVAAPIATPEKSSQSSSTGDTLEEITEENEHKINCTKSESDQSLPMTTSAPFVKPVRMKQRSGQRAYSESEAQSLLTANPISSIVPGASITSMASTGSYTDNPGFLTLRSIHSRHRPVLDFIETGDDHDHGTAQERIKRSDSVSAKKRHSSGSGTTGRKLSTVNNRKKLLGPLKDEDMSKIVNDRYWGITLPAKMDALLSDKIENTLLEEIDISNPPASPGNFEYHSEETCLQCYNYLDINQTSPLGKFSEIDLRQTRRKTSFLIYCYLVQVPDTGQAL